MTRRSHSCIAVLCVWSTGTLAAPCVTDTFDRPLEGATEVTAHVSDVPSAQFPAFWQDGTLGGYRYRMFASAEATLSPAVSEQEWDISITCDVVAQQCNFADQGTPPSDARAVSTQIGQCLLGVTPKLDAPTAQPQDAVEPVRTTKVAPITAATKPATCGSASVSEATDVATMQRLLVMAGADPGPIDGFLGPKSFAAMEVFVPDANWDTSIPDVIAILDARMCDASD